MNIFVERVREVGMLRNAVVCAIFVIGHLWTYRPLRRRMTTRYSVTLPWIAWDVQRDSVELDGKSRAGSAATPEVPLEKIVVLDRT